MSAPVDPAMVRRVRATEEQIAAIEAKFADRAGESGIRLPAGAAQNREPGHIFEKGYHIGFLCGEADGEEYLELLIQGFAMDDMHAAGGRPDARRTSRPPTNTC